MTLGKLVAGLFLGLALASGCGSSGPTGNEGQCKEGRVWYQGECCPDDNDNGICDWVDDGTVVGQDAYSADSGTAVDTPKGTDTCSKENICLKEHPSGRYCLNGKIVECGDPCSDGPLAGTYCPEDTYCIEGECKNY